MHFYPQPPISDSTLYEPVCDHDSLIDLYDVYKRSGLNNPYRDSQSYEHQELLHGNRYVFHFELKACYGLIELFKSQRLGWWANCVSKCCIPTDEANRLGVLIAWRVTEQQVWEQQTSSWRAPKLPLTDYSPITSNAELYYFHWLISRKIFEHSFDADFFKPEERLFFRFSHNGVPMLAKATRSLVEWRLKNLYYSEKYRACLEPNEAETLLNDLNAALKTIPEPSNWPLWKASGPKTPQWDISEEDLGRIPFCEVDIENPSMNGSAFPF